MGTSWSTILGTAAKLIVGIAVALTATPSAAQENQFDEFHTWLDIQTISNFSGRFRYDGDYGIRGLLTGDDWALLYIRPSVRYQAQAWMSLHGGAALFYNFVPGADVPELRPWVGIRLVGPRPGGWVISNYFRLEYRAFYLSEESEWESSLRGRWQLQAASPRFSIGSAQEFFTLASIEPFFETGSIAADAFGDRFRFNLGIGKHVSERLRIEVNYLYHKVRVPERGGALDVDDHVVRVRFFYSFNPP